MCHTYPLSPELQKGDHFWMILLLSIGKRSFTFLHTYIHTAKQKISKKIEKAMFIHTYMYTYIQLFAFASSAC